MVTKVYWCQGQSVTVLIQFIVSVRDLMQCTVTSVESSGGQYGQYDIVR